MRRSVWLPAALAPIVEAGATYLAWRGAATQLPSNGPDLSQPGEKVLAACVHVVAFAGG